VTDLLFTHFVTLWVVIDPIGTIPVFIAVTAMTPPKLRKRVARDASLIAIGVLLFFLVLGQLLIEALGIGLYAFQVAGGIVLFLFALTMIFGEPKPQKDQHFNEDCGSTGTTSPAVFPLAVPSLASPGAMLAVVLLTDNRQFEIAAQAMTAGLMIAVMGFAYLCMRLADKIIKLIGNEGSAIVSRVMGMILASVAADSVLSALLHIFETGQMQ
jgi:multiple antibiotic resistance protein